MSDSELITKVKVEPEVKFGSFANAFRIVEEIGEDCFLDFMVYSAQEQEAIVVARVRVRRDFIPAIRDRLIEAQSKFSAPEAANDVSKDIHRKNGETLH